MTWKKTQTLANHVIAIQRYFDPSWITGQSAVLDNLGHFFLQGEAAEQFLGFTTVLALNNSYKPEVANFGLLYSTLGELYIQNWLPWFTYNMSGISSLIFIGF